MKKKHVHRDIIEQVPVDYYQQGIEHNLLQKLWHTNKLRIILELITYSPRTILDVGCASGWFLSRLAKKFPNAICCGIDLYDDAIDYGKKLYPHITFRIADAHRIPFKKQTFDFVVCTEVLEHVNNPKDVLLEIKRVLKKNGVAVIELDSGSFLFSFVWYLWRKIHGKVWNDAHLHSFTVSELERLLTLCGFRIVRKRTFNLGMAMAFLIEKKDA